MSDFSDRPLVAGSLIGKRAFAVDALGRLTGPSHGHTPFTPDENSASCGAGFDSMARAIRRYQRRLDAFTLGQPAPKTPTTSEHTVGGLGCSCGFYAYFDTGSNPYAGPETVEALIEGYGTCTVGDRGFRAEKARLVALVDPNRDASTGQCSPRWDRFSSYVWDHDWVVAPPFIAGLVLIYATVFAFIAAWPLGVVSLVALFGVIAAGVAVMRASAHGLDRKYRSVSPKAARCHDAGHTTSRIDFEHIRSLYPDVPVYPTLKAAIAAHPLTLPPLPEIPTPETAEDFWTRSAS